ncbi:MAG: hypothetical protein LBL62_02360 [Planctomycetaceae bacterium]|jgi:hypothetical protein|nr:hypothetical protein [Planctomycetaceae bacterium]
MTPTNRTKCRCPSCGAEQVWQDECRRCRTDLRELRLLNENSLLLEQKLTDALDIGDYRQAVRYAQKLEQMDPVLLKEVLRQLSLSPDFGKNGANTL